MRQEGAEPPVQDQGFMLRDRSGLSEAQVQLLGTVTNGVFDCPVFETATLRLFTRMHLVDRAPPPANTQNSGVGSGAGGRGAGACRYWGGRAGRGPSAWRPAAVAYAAGAIDDEGSSEAVGSEADDEDGDELERALGRSLDRMCSPRRRASPAGNPWVRKSWTTTSRRRSSWRRPYGHARGLSLIHI